MQLGKKVDYKDRHFLLPDGSYDETTNVLAISRRMKNGFGFSMDGSAQRKEGVLTLYPQEWFSPMDFYTGRLAATNDTVAIHRFESSWHDEASRRERAVRCRCVKLLGEDLGLWTAKVINYARRRDGSFRRAADRYLIQPFVMASRLLPLEDTVVFETEGDFCDNGRALYEYMLSAGMDRRWRILWLVEEPERFRARERENVRFLRRDSRAALYAAVRARYLFFTHSSLLKTRRKGQTVVSLWHGVPLKAGDGRDMSCTFDFLTTSSPETFELFHKFLGVRPEQYLPLGQPRLDLLFRAKDVSALLGGRTRGRDYEKLALCMPTFRQTALWTDSAFVNTYSINPIGTPAQLEELNAFLRKEKLLLTVKIHHLQKLDFLKRTDLSNILYLTDDDLAAQDIQLYEFVGQADCLLTDYSSIYFDYLLLDRPIGFFIGDLGSYTRGFTVEDPLAWMPGQKIASAEELRSFLKDVRAGRDGYGGQRKALLDKVDVYQDGSNCRRIAEHFHL